MTSWEKRSSTREVRNQGRLGPCVRDSCLTATPGRNVERSLVLDSFGSIVCSFAVILLSIPTSIILARFLGPQGKGEITFLLLFVAQIAQLFSCGVDVALTHYGGQRCWDMGRLASWSLGLGLGLGSGAAVTALLVVLIVPSHLLFASTPVVLMSLAVAIVIPVGFLRSVIRVSGRIIEDRALDVMTRAINLLAVGALVACGFGVTGALYGFLIGSMFLALAVTCIARTSGIVTGYAKYDRQVWQALLRYGMKWHVGDVIQQLNYRLDFYLVAYLLGAASLGIYAVAVTFAESLWIVPNALGPVIMQRMSQVGPRDPARRSNSLASLVLVTRMTSMALMAVAVGYLIVGSSLITVLFGESFSSAYAALATLLPGAWAVGVSKGIASALAGRGYPHLRAYAAMVVAPLALILDLFLIPSWGILGAAAASSTAYGAFLLVIMVLYQRTTGDRAMCLLSPQINQLWQRARY